MTSWAPNKKIEIKGILALLKALLSALSKLSIHTLVCSLDTNRQFFINPPQFAATPSDKESGKDKRSFQ